MLTINMYGATVFSLAIALTVFVLLTAMLIILLILLGVSKSFRAVFFHENTKKSKARKSASKESVSKAAPVMPDVDIQPAPTPVQPVEQPAPQPARRERRQRTPNQPDFLEAVPTVPLNAAFTEPAPKQKQRTQTAFIPRTIPIPRTGSRDASVSERTVTIEPIKPAARKTPAASTRGTDTSKPKK